MIRRISTARLGATATAAAAAVYYQCRPNRRLLATTKTTKTALFSNIAVTTEQERPPLRRCLLSVPGADARKIQKAATTLGGIVDTIVLDLEDGVAVDYKDQARTMVHETLLDESITVAKNNNKSELAVRINALDDNTGTLAIQDLQAILPCPRLQAIVIPKVECAEHVLFVTRMIAALSPAPNNVHVLAAIESARGILNLRDICAASVASAARSSNGSSNQSPLDALIFASEDYCANIGAIRTTAATELLYARSHLVTCAKAYDLQAIDMVHINFRNLQELAVECRSGRELGFTGKQAIHPAQVATIQECFAPSKDDFDYARKCVEAYEATTALGKGACVVNGIVVDLPVYKWAVAIVNRTNKAAGAGADGSVMK
jgi:citrate lyase subunit beta-like protein